MFLVLMRNGDPYCGGDYEFCKNEKELKECMSINFVYHIYKINKKNNPDLVDIYLKKFKDNYNNFTSYK